MKRLLKSGIYGFMNCTWCTVCYRKVNIYGYCSLNSTWTVTAFCQNAWKKKKKKKKRKTQTWVQNVDPNIHLVAVWLARFLMSTFFFFFSNTWTVASHGFTVYALFITVHVLKNIKNDPTILFTHLKIILL